MGLNVGDPIPLLVQLATYDATKFVRAFVQNVAGDAIPGSPFDLTPDGDTGLYKNVDGVMPNQPWIFAEYLVYDDSDYETLSEGNGGSGEVFYRNVTPGSTPYLPPTSNIVAIVEGDNCSSGPIEDVIVQGSARLLTIRLASAVGGIPFDLTDADAIEFRMRNTDGSILSLDLDDNVQVVNAGGGQIAVTLSAVQTAALAPAIPAPATIKVTIDTQVTVINLATQIAVEEAEV